MHSLHLFEAGVSFKRASRRAYGLCIALCRLASTAKRSASSANATLAAPLVAAPMAERKNACAVSSGVASHRKRRAPHPLSRDIVQQVVGLSVNPKRPRRVCKGRRGGGDGRTTESLQTCTYTPKWGKGRRGILPRKKRHTCWDSNAARTSNLWC